MADLRFAFLVLEGHPFGREMLRQLLAAGFVPELLIEECSEVADQERAKFLARMRGFSIAPELAALVHGKPIRRLKVGDHNGAACEQALADSLPELVVLGGTRVLKPRVFAHAQRGTLNAHPGLLPELRGAASVAWAIALDLPIGCTCHFIDAGVDTGPIVARRTLEVRRGASYEQLCHAATALAGALMTEAVGAAARGALTATPQVGAGARYRNMDDGQLAAVKRKLADGHYAHFVD
jgi:folate-dependent phosphoribosylglycinamide formyltransferase PurN